MGDVGAKPDDGDHEEQHDKRRERPGDGEGTHALAALALGFFISHHEVQSSGIGAMAQAKALLHQKRCEQQEQVQHGIGEEILGRALGLGACPLGVARHRQT